jgi:hypothetical protein
MQACFSHTHVKIVFQTGTWDTFYWSPRNFIYNPLYGPALVKAIRYLMKHKCQHYIRIVYITAMPEISKKSSWSNNYTIKALTQWLQQQFISLNYSNFEVVDGYEIVYPTVTGHRHDDVCDNHYLCHPAYEDVVLQTVAGKAVLSSMLHALCRNDHTDSTTRSDNKHDTDDVITSAVVTEEVNDDLDDRSRHDRQVHHDSTDLKHHLSRYMRTHDHFMASGMIISMVAKKDGKTIGSRDSMDIVTTNESSSTVTAAVAAEADNNDILSINRTSIHCMNITNNITSSSISSSISSSRLQQPSNVSTISLHQSHDMTHHPPPPVVYMMWNGLRRQLSIDTLHCYNYTESDIIYVNKSIIKAIPMDMPLPVMKDKHLLRTEDMHVYVIDNCTKRYIPSHRLKHELTFEYLGYQLPNPLTYIDIVDSYDLDDIPHHHHQNHHPTNRTDHSSSKDDIIHYNHHHHSNNRSHNPSEYHGNVTYDHVDIHNHNYSSLSSLQLRADVKILVFAVWVGRRPLNVSILNHQLYCNAVGYEYRHFYLSRKVFVKAYGDIPSSWYSVIIMKELLMNYTVPSSNSSSSNRSNSISSSFDYFLKLDVDCLFATTAIRIEAVIDPLERYSVYIQGNVNRKDDDDDDDDNYND